MIKKSFQKNGLILVLATMLAGCAVGPDFKTPAASLVPAHFARDDAQRAVSDGDMAMPNAASTDFWQRFGDPQLSALIERALQANPDVQSSLARYDRANALLRQANFDRFPTVTASAQGGRQRVSQDQSFGFPRNTNTYSAGIDASWELDFFGRVRRGIEAQRAEVRASASDVLAMQVAIVGQVASTYIDLRGQQAHLRIAREHVDNLRRTLNVVDARMAAGRGGEFEQAQARAQLETAVARIPVLEAAVAVDEHRLAVLTGQPPEALIAVLDAPASRLSLPTGVDPGTPADLLRRRPDVAAAEARLHAATARIGVATADLFPRVSLGGLLGTQAFQLGVLFNGGSETHHVLLGIDWSFLDVGRVRARIAASRADAADQLAQYQQVVLRALEDTENALVRYARFRREDTHLEQAERDSAHAAQLARMRFNAGQIDLYETLGIERDLLDARDAQVDSRMRGATAAVALYQALAGGWPRRAPALAQR